MDISPGNKKIGLVVNARARKAAAQISVLKQALHQNNINLASEHLITKPDECEPTVQKLVQEKYDLIIIGGGDGTISSVVDYFAYTDSVLGIIPLGTANSFARSLDIPLTIEGAVNVIAQGRVKKVDLGKINDDYFANTASIGISTAVARNIKNKTKKLFGKLAYLFVGTYYLLSHTAFTSVITDGNETIKMKALEIYIANGKYHGGIEVAETARPDSRDVHIRTISGDTLWHLIKGWIAILFGRAEQAVSVADIKIEDVTLVTNPIQYIAIDGEVVGRTPARISVAAAALNVMVPKAV